VLEKFEAPGSSITQEIAALETEAPKKFKAGSIALLDVT